MGRMMDAITAAHDGDIQMIDSTSVRAHQQAATAKKGDRDYCLLFKAASTARKICDQRCKRLLQHNLPPTDIDGTLFDHLAGARERPVRHVEPERPGGPEI